MTAIGRAVVGRLRSHTPRILAGVAAVTAASLAELAKPWPIKVVVDQVLSGRPLNLPGLVGPIEPQRLLVFAALALVGLHAALGALSLASNRLTIAVGQRMVQDLRTELFAHLERLPLRFHEHRSSGELVYRLAADTMALQTMAMNAVFPTLSAVLFLVGMVVVMLRLNAELTALALAVVPLIALAVRVLGRRVEDVARSARQLEGDLYAAADRSMSAVRVTRAFSAEDLEGARFAAASRASLDRHLSLYTTQTAYSFAVGVLGALGTAAVLWLGARLVLAGLLTVGDLLVFVAYLASFYAPISTLSQTFGLVQEARAGLRRVFEVLELVPDQTDGPTTLDRDRVRGRISLEAVEAGYEPGRPVLHGVSLEVHAGEKLAIVGPSGSGKTTIARLLLRFLDPEQGTVRLDGVDVRSLTLRSLREAMGAVLQPPTLLPATVGENVCYGRADVSRTDIENALRAAQLWDVVCALPQGIDTPVTDAGGGLSQGERQRLTVARALLKRAPVLVLDEPTAALDELTERRLLASLERERRGRTCILIAHGAAALAWADRLAILREGRVVAVGTPAELAHRPELRVGREARAEEAAG